MEFDLRNRLDKIILHLHERARAQAHPNRDRDMSLLLVANAVALEALRVLSDDLAALKSRLDHQ